MKRSIFKNAFVALLLTVIKGSLSQTTCNNGQGRVLYERLPNQQLQGFDDDVVRDTAPPFRVLEKCQDLCLRDRTASNNLVRACTSFDFQPGSRIASFSGSAEYEESTCYLTREQAVPEGIGNLMLVPNSVHFTEVCLSSSRPERECPSRRYVFERYPRKKLKLPVSDIKEITAANRSDCEDKCLNEFSFVCRSANFDSTLRSCSLSRFTRRTHPELLEDDSNSDYLENTCLNAERRCDGLVVYVKEENKKLGGPFEVDIFNNMTLEECQSMCLRAEKYFCRSVEFDDQTRQCILSEEDSISQKDDLSISSSPTHHFYDLVCLDNQRGSEYPDNSVTSHLFGGTNGRRPDTAFQRYRNSRLGGEFHSEITGRSLSECLDECLRQTSFQCRSAVYSDRFRTCRLSRYNQRDGMRIIYDADYDYYENLMQTEQGSTRPDDWHSTHSNGQHGGNQYPDGGRYPSTMPYDRPGFPRPEFNGRYPTSPGPDYPGGAPDRYPGGSPDRYPGGSPDRYAPGADRYPMQPGGDRYGPMQPGGDRYGPMQPGGDRYGPMQPGGDRYGPMQPGGDRYGPMQPGGDRYPPSRTPPGGDRYPTRIPGGPSYPGPMMPDSNRYGPMYPDPNRHGPMMPDSNHYYPPMPVSRPPYDNNYPPVNSNAYPGDDRYGGNRERYPVDPPGRERYPEDPVSGGMIPDTRHPPSRGQPIDPQYSRPSYRPPYPDTDPSYHVQYPEMYPESKYPSNRYPVSMNRFPVGNSLNPMSILKYGNQYGGSSGMPYPSGGQYGGSYGGPSGGPYGGPSGGQYGGGSGQYGGQGRYPFSPGMMNPDMGDRGYTQKQRPPYIMVGFGGGGGGGQNYGPDYDNNALGPGSDTYGQHYGPPGAARPISTGTRCDENDSYKQMGLRQRMRKQFVRRGLKVETIVECQRECSSSRDFICRSFNYKDSPTSFDGDRTASNGVESYNCELSDRDTRELDVHNPMMFDPANYDFYERSMGARSNSNNGECLDVSQVCNEDGMEFSLRTTEPFAGRIYSYGFYDRCFFRGNGGTVNVLRISGPSGFPECGTQRYGDTITNIIVVQFSDNVQTGRDKRFNLTCLFRGPGESVVTSGYIGAGSGSPIPIEYLPAENSMSSRVRLMILYQGRPTTTIAVGDPLTFRLETQDGYNHINDIFATNVVARDPYSGRSVQLIDRYGCPVDTFVFPELGRSRDGDSLEARFNAFKIPESNFLVFEATVKTCRDGCQPAYCNGASGRSEPSFGRRKRSLNDTLNVIESEDIENDKENATLVVEHKVSEEVKVESNNDSKDDLPEQVREMIEVFESREEMRQDSIAKKFISPTIESVCLSTSEYYGLITSIILLMLLLIVIAIVIGFIYRKYWSSIVKNRSFDYNSPGNSYLNQMSYTNSNKKPFSPQKNMLNGENNRSSSSISIFGNGLQKTFATGNLSRICQIPVINPINIENNSNNTFDDSEPIYTDPSLFERSR
ncbi:unnamed protein product [Diamesa hyperborea]